MDENIEMLHELCETVMRDLEKCTEKIRKSGGEISAGDVDYLDKLTHTLKSVKTTVAMMEADDGYSGRYSRDSYDDGMSERSYRRMSRDGRSYARKRYADGRYAPYSREGSSADGNKNRLLDGLNGALMEAEDDGVRREIKKLVEKVESM